METTDKIHKYNAWCDYAVQERKIQQEKKIEGHNSSSGCIFKLGGQECLHSEDGDYIKLLQLFQFPVPKQDHI